MNLLRTINTTNVILAKSINTQMNVFCNIDDKTKERAESVQNSELKLAQSRFDKERTRSRTELQTR
jgi:hypothetical protein